MYIGIDIGTRLIGWAVIDADGEYLKSHWVELGDTTSRGLKGWFSLLVRLGNLARWAECFFSDFSSEEVIVVGIEHPWVGKNAQTAVTLGMAWGIVAGAALSRGLSIDKIESAQAKLALTGYGKATKSQMVLHARIHGAKCVGAGEMDEADAIGVALAARGIDREKVLSQT